MPSFTEQDLLSVTKSPGAQYLLAGPEKILNRLNAGYADVVKQTPVTNETTFNAYSTTKTFTAAAVLKLAEQGKIGLEDQVNALLPQFSFSHKFTVRQLLSHQAGIANPLPLRWIHLADEAFDDKAFSDELILKHLKLNFTPGTKMSYTNVGYIVAGKLIEKASGVDYKTFVRKNILKPVVRNGYIDFSISQAPHSTGYHWKYSLTNLVLSFMIDKGKYMQAATGVWAAFRKIYVNGSSYGGLIANAAGMVEYLQALLQNRLLSESSMTQLFTLHRDNMCLSWYKGKLGKLDYYCHAGGGGGYYCEIRVYPQIKTASVLMTNHSGFSDQRMLDKIDRHFIPWN